MKDIFSLKGKSILVTGASSGIGKEIAIACSGFGAALTITGRNKDRLDGTFNALEGHGHQLICGDLTKKEDRVLISNGPRFDGVVFNAGIVEYLPVRFISEEKITKILHTNFNSTVLLCQQLLKNKQINRQGSLIFISSISSKFGVPGTALYASSKAALSAFARVLASEIANQGIRSNSVSSGIVVTPMTEQAQAVTSEEKLNEERKKYPLDYGSVRDVSGLVVYLLSDASKWMTGSDLTLDGGFSLQ